MQHTQNHILVVVADAETSAWFDRILRDAGFAVTLTENGASALRQAPVLDVTLAIIGERVKDGPGINFAQEFGRLMPALPVILLASRESPDAFRRAMRAGVAELICLPIKPEEMMRAVRGALESSRRRKEALLQETSQKTSSLQRQVDELETLTRLGRQVIASLDLDSTLASIVDAAVQLTGAEEGSLLLLDEATGDLYMRAARNFQEDFVRTFRLPITDDNIAGQVIRTGEAALCNEDTPQKIKTSYLVQSLLYAPLSIHGHVFGILGVDNRHSRLPLTQRHVALLNALSSFAVIALENARLFSEEAAGRAELGTILAGIQDGVVVIDQDQRLGMVNRAARRIFGLAEGENLSGRPFQEIFSQEELINLVAAPENGHSNRSEISPDDSRVFSVEINPIIGIGRVLTLHDITYLKQLDRIKTDFVHTVSHDLRSPLTAILGYVELIERAGHVTNQQRDFIRRVQVSVRSITHLIDDLLDLGRIESGFDVRKENLRIDQIVRYSAEGLKKQLSEKDHHLQINFPEDFPSILANPVQIRQMSDNLLDNAIKYTAPGGSIGVAGSLEQNQIILQFADTGIGIPSMDLPYIFDKFYRASNISNEISGTGLGLSIVKSIIEGHGGRIWVESTPGKGTVFTVVLPFIQS